MKMSSEMEKKPVVSDVQKSSNEILSELFSTFHAAPPLIIKTEKGVDDDAKKHKKSKKKHKHKDRKKKKKDKKRKRNSSSSSEDSDIDLAKLLIKQEKEVSEKKIKIEGTDIEISVPPSLEKLKTEEHNESFPEVKVERKEKNSQVEEGEIDASDSDGSNKSKQKKRKRKSEERSDKKRHKKESTSNREKSDKHVHHSRSKERHNSKQYSSKSFSRDRSKEQNKAKSSDKEVKYRHRNRSRDKKPSRDRDSSKERNRYREYKSKDLHIHNDFHKSSSTKHRECELDDNFYRKRNRDNPFYKNDDGKHKDKEERWSTTNRYREYDDRDRNRNYRDRSDLRDDIRIDKKKLLEIARKNAIQMMKSGNLPGALTLGPQAQEKVIAAIKAGGKTVEELTDFCKTLFKKEELGELSSPEEENHGSDSETDKPFHHPFQIKDRPTSITMNIKNSVPLPLKTTQERTSELRIQFPVSSGQQHRKTEEWIPVAPKKTDCLPPKDIPLPPTPAPVPSELPKPTIPAPPNAPPGPQVFPTPTVDSAIDIGSVVSQRLTAMRKLQENPNDVQALTQIYKANKEMQSWAQSKQPLGQFTGSTGANILSQSELSSGYQAWAKKDQLQTTTPVTGGMGMHLLQKMGWKPGEGLGKEKTGTLEPLLLEVKLDKKGLVATEEQRKKKPKQHSNPQVNPSSQQNKHPVSLLGEYASKSKLGAPQYVLCFECGPDHKKNFLFKVLLNGVEYKPSVTSATKKEAKANAAKICLQHMGLMSAES